MRINIIKVHLLASDRAPIPVYAGHIPGLVTDLDIPEWTLLPVETVPVPFLLDELPGLRIFDHSVLSSSSFSFPALRLTC